MTGTIHSVGQAERNGRLKERLADCVADFNESDDPLQARRADHPHPRPQGGDQCRRGQDSPDARRDHNP